MDYTVSAARAIVWERTGAWAAALRQAAGDRPLPLTQVRSLAACEGALAAAPASFVLVELGPAPLPALVRLAGWQRDFPRVRLAVVAPRELAWAEPLAGEVGAVYFTTSPRQLGPLVAAIGRHLARAPRPELGWREQVWQRLPWKPSAVQPPTQGKS